MTLKKIMRFSTQTFKGNIFTETTHTHLMALFRDYPGEPVPER